MINSKGPLVCCVEGVEQVVQVVLCQPIRGQYYQHQPTRGQYYQHQPIRGQYYLSTKSPTLALHIHSQEDISLKSVKLDKKLDLINKLKSNAQPTKLISIQSHHISPVAGMWTEARTGCKHVEVSKITKTNI